MAEPEDGTPVVIRHEDQIIINVPKSDIRVPIQFKPSPIETHFHVNALRRDIILAVIAAALVAGLFF